MAKQKREMELQVIAGSDMVFDLNCEVCGEFNKHIEASGFCVECSDYLCTNCVDAHSINKLSMRHAVQTKSHMPRQKPSPPPVKPKAEQLTEKCDTHPGRVVEYYCRDDGSLACSVCLVKHRRCQTVDHISDLQEHLLDSRECQQFTASLTTLQTQAKGVINSVKIGTLQAEKLHTDVTTDLQDLRQKVNQVFDKLDTYFKETIIPIKSADLKKIVNIRDTSKYVLSEVEKISTEVQTLQSKSQLCQLFVRMIKLEDRVHALHTAQDDVARKNNVTTYRFEPGTAAQTFLDKPDAIGILSIEAPVTRQEVPVIMPPVSQKLNLRLAIPANQTMLVDPLASASTKAAPSTTTQNKDVKSACPKKHHSTFYPSAAPTTMPPSDVKTTVVGAIDVEAASDDYVCDITGIALLPGNRILLADCDNDRIKLCNLQTSKVKSELKVISPYDVAIITGEQVAVTLPNVRKIAFIRVSSFRKRLKLDKEIHVGGKCTGIVHNNCKLIVAYVHPVKIEIMTLNGKVEKKIPVDCSSMLNWPSHMALGPKHDVIYVSDSNSNCVKRLRLDGTVEAVYKDKQLNGPRGISVDRQGRVIVCGAGSHNIHLLTPELTKIKLLVDRVNSPRSLCLCHSKDRLYVGSYDDKNYTIIYKLSEQTVLVDSSWI